jgi:protoheme IX farnesyltransferase
MLRDHYAAADVPMLPVARGEQMTRRQIVIYTVALSAVTLAPVALGEFGAVYLAAAIALDSAFLALALGLARRPTRRRAALVFHASLLYLALVFVAMAVDAAL